jgi:hypothetical protein
MADAPDSNDPPPSHPQNAEDLVASFFSCGPGNDRCTCECGKGGPCGHQWDGEGESITYEDGGGMESASCSKCGMLAIDHSMWLF